MMIGFIREMRSKRISITTSNYLTRLFVFAVQQCREIWIGAKMICASELRQPQPAAVITGCGSYLIQPSFFDESLWDYSEASQGAFYMDDIWIGGCLTRRNVKRYVVPASAMMRSVFRQRRTLSLHDVPNGRQYNNNETIAFFGKTWDVFASH
jgi:hypothetical protein